MAFYLDDWHSTNRAPNGAFYGRLTPRVSVVCGNSAGAHGRGGKLQAPAVFGLSERVHSHKCCLHTRSLGRARFAQPERVIVTRLDPRAKHARHIGEIRFLAGKSCRSWFCALCLLARKTGVTRNNRAGASYRSQVPAQQRRRRASWRLTGELAPRSCTRSSGRLDCRS